MYVNLKRQMQNYIHDSIVVNVADAFSLCVVTFIWFGLGRDLPLKLRWKPFIERVYSCLCRLCTTVRHFHLCKPLVFLWENIRSLSSYSTCCVLALKRGQTRRFMHRAHVQLAISVWLYNPHKFSIANPFVAARRECKSHESHTDS